MFYSPIAWVLLILFVVQCGYGLVKGVGRIDFYLDEGWKYSFSEVLLNSGVGIFNTLYEYVYLYVPLLTMGLISEELRNKNIYLLYAAPLSNAQIILGKFLSTLVFGCVLSVIVFIFILFGAVAVQDFEWGVALSGLLGLFLMFAAYAAIGLFVSSLTSYPIVAAIGSFVILGALSSVASLWQEYDFFRDITWWLSINGRAGELMRGLICSEDVLYFIIIAVAFVWLTIIRLNAIRQKVRFSVTLGKNLAVIVAACLLGYLTSRPALMCYHDATITDYNTLAPGSQKVLTDLQGEVTIRTYRNLLNMEGWETGIFFINENKERFRQYVRFNPRIQFEDVYYYDTVLTQYNKNVTPEEWDKQLNTMVELLRVKEYYSPQEVRQHLDIDTEGKGFVWQLVNEENGRETCLRIYHDLWKFPFESEISAALKRLVATPVQVGVVEGFGGRSIHDKTSKGLYFGTIAPNVRNALINQGFDVWAVDLSHPVPDSIAILTIADLQEPLTAEADLHLQAFIDRGGNLYVTGEPRSQETMNPIFEKFGFELMRGSLVQLDSILLPDRLTCYVTEEASALSYWFGRPGSEVDIVGTAGVRQTGEAGYEVVPLFRTDTAGVWNEVETEYITEEHPVVFNPEAGEKMDTYFTSVALRRMVNGKEQRIVLSGDTDFLVKEVGGVGMAPYSWLANGEAPVDVRRPARTDHVFKVDLENAKIFARTMQYGASGALLVAFLIMLFRRRGR